MEKMCNECPWLIRNDNNDTIVEHSKKWDKKHNCHMKIKGRNLPLWDEFPKFHCVGNKKLSLR